MPDFSPRRGVPDRGSSQTEHVGAIPDGFMVRIQTYRMAPDGAAILHGDEWLAAPCDEIINLGDAR